MAVFTPVSHDEAAAFLSNFSIGELTGLTGIKEGVENTNYLVKTDQGRFILTLFENRVEDHDLPFFLGFMAHLRAAGIGVARIISDRAGSQINRLNGRAAIIVQFLDGTALTDPAPRHGHQLGLLMAEMHLAAGSFTRTRENPLSFQGWQKLAEQCLPRADQVDPALPGLIEEELAFLSTTWPSLSALPKGVIHADLFPDNIFFQDDQLSGVIDFYFACSDYFAYDLAITLTAWAFTSDEKPDEEKMTAILSGYEHRRSLSGAERTALPVLLRGASLRFLLTRLQDWLWHDAQNLVTPKDPMQYALKTTAIRSLPHDFFA